MRTDAEVDRELRHLQHGPVTLERVAVAWMARPRAENTRRGMRSLIATHLAPLLAQPVASLDVPNVSAWIEQLELAGLMSTTIATAWRKLRVLGRYALERGWIGALPWGEWHPSIKGAASGEPREAARSVAELVRLLIAARELDLLEGRARRDRYDGLEAKIGVAALLGLRQGELGGLRWPDIDTGPECAVFVARQWDDKPLKRGTEPRLLETIAELGDILERHRKALEARDLYAVRGPLFPHRKTSRPGKPAHYQRGQVLESAALRRVVERAGLPNVRSWSGHSLRDSFVTLETAATGGDLKRVQARSRHATLASLARYIRALSRNHPAAPALRILPGLRADAAGTPLLGTPKETPS
jgi:integrase